MRDNQGEGQPALLSDAEIADRAVDVAVGEKPEAGKWARFCPLDSDGRLVDASG
jgi:hypothetical protein